jgi:hypothetical protein
MSFLLWFAPLNSYLKAETVKGVFLWLSADLDICPTWTPWMLTQPIAMPYLFYSRSSVRQNFSLSLGTSHSKYTIHPLSQALSSFPFPRPNNVRIHPRQMVINRIILLGFRSLQSWSPSVHDQQFLKLVGILQEHPYKPSAVSPRPDILKLCILTMPSML